MRTRDAALIAIGIVTGATFSSLIVMAWAGPTSAPPNGNVSAPINVGSVDQVKNANLGLNGLAVFGNSILQASSYLNWGATSGSTGYGIRDNAGTLEFKNSDGSWASLQTTVYNLTTGTGGITSNVLASCHWGRQQGPCTATCPAGYFLSSCLYGSASTPGGVPDLNTQSCTGGGGPSGGTFTIICMK